MVTRAASSICLEGGGVRCVAWFAVPQRGWRLHRQHPRPASVRRQKAWPAARPFVMPFGGRPPRREGGRGCKYPAIGEQPAC